MSDCRAARGWCTNLRTIRLALLTAVLFASGCTVYEYEDVGARNPEAFFGTQPGYHALSDSFAVEVRDYLMRFYFLGATSGTKEPIGVIWVSWYDRSDYGSRQMAYAISSDGKRLLFFDEPAAATGGPPDRVDFVDVSDLYLFDADSGQRQLVHPNVHRRESGCVDVALNYLPFGVVHSIANIEPFVRSTEGEELSLVERKKRLLAAGQPERVCGPL